VKIPSPKLHTAHLTANEEALLRCRAALDQKDRADYEGAQETMRRYWKRIGDRPQTRGLHGSVAAEVFLCVGILTGWIGSKVQIADAQETAKNLISEAIDYFDSAGDQKMVAAARVELAYCYWRNGELNEARDMLNEALRKLTTEGDTRARAILKLTTVEWSAARYHEALTILEANATLFQKIPNHTTKGTFHTQLANMLTNVATANNRTEYFQRAIKEYVEADNHFKIARNPVFRASVKNNVAYLLIKLSRFKEAHKHLNEARRLTVSFRDKARTAQIDDSRAQALIGEGKLKEAEVVARKAASALESSGHQCLVADVLITQGIALARLGRKERAQFILQKAVSFALKVEAHNQAGLAALTLIEEVEELPPATLQAAYQQAREWLASSQDQGVLMRLSEAAGKLAASLRGGLSAEDATEILSTEPGDLQESMLKYEASLIKRALVQANGSVTRAASLLGTSYQALCYIIETRQRHLMTERSPVRRRPRKGLQEDQPETESANESGDPIA
jgi:tetratricopeptide (TPR) repeat protein